MIICLGAAAVWACPLLAAAVEARPRPVAAVVARVEAADRPSGAALSTSALCRVEREVSGERRS